jgi:hypothetical protein
MKSEKPRECDTAEIVRSVHSIIEAPIIYVAAQSRALVLAAKYLSKLEIQPHEYVRYFGKAHHLAANYVGFSQKASLQEAYGAGKAGAFACIYDVLSDWSKDHPNPELIFEEILQEEAGNELKELALSLFKKDTSQNLENDGLERGYIAFLFTLKMMGVDSFYEAKGGIKNLGEILQIVDDIWDLERDTAEGQTNCLLTERRDTHLQRLVSFCAETDLDELFPHGPLLVQVIKATERKAKKWLAES